MEGFTERLETLMEYFGLPASALADKIQVQRSGISHLLSGRNKPSLEFVTKLRAAFPELDLYWLLEGKGTMIQMKDVKEEKTDQHPAPSLPPPTKAESSERLSDIRSLSNAGKENPVKKIIVLYQDGSFESYDPA